MKDPLELIIEWIKDDPKDFIGSLISSILLLIGFYAFVVLAIIFLG